MTPHEALREIKQLAGFPAANAGWTLTRVERIATAALAETDDTVAVPRELMKLIEKILDEHAYYTLRETLLALLGDKP
jgi:hypothetical protein